MLPLYEILIADSLLDADRALLDSMRAKLDDELKKLDEKYALLFPLLYNLCSFLAYAQKLRDSIGVGDD